MNNKKGFTLIELLVVVLIIGILAAMAMPQYFKAVERSRMTEADQLLASIAQAQQRKYLQINKYTTDYRSLDVAPKGATGSTFYTKGDPEKGGGNGFEVVMSGTTYADGEATATRVAGTSGTLQYKYTLSRKYTSDKTTCSASDANAGSLCADFCGVDISGSAASFKCCNDGKTGECTDTTTTTTPPTP